jgi:tryptophan 2,3-dioxygenase
MSFTPEALERLKLLEDKFASMGQDLVSYLDGLLYANYTTYWDYINLDTLLSLQATKTDFPDEKIFVVYHQITELYFNLCLHELNQIQALEKPEARFIIDRVKRINQYFDSLIRSFGVMVMGMDKEQFLKFRMSLLPASGFQSAQYRKIEICSTDFNNLLVKEKRGIPEFDGVGTEDLFEHIYWKTGATELATGKKTLTLRQFEDKYSTELIALAKYSRDNNLWTKYNAADKTAEEDAELKAELRELDLNVNVRWPMQHMRSAARYLDRKPEAIAATGGTNWQKYLPPRFQLRIFYPTLWSAEELENWGRTGMGE